MMGFDGQLPDGADVADCLQAILRKENRSAYKLRDYLDLKDPSHGAFGAWHQHRGHCQKNAIAHPTKRRRLGACEWEMSAQCRWQIGQWFFKMVEDFDFPEEFAMVAMNYFDRVLSRSEPLPESKRDVQLLALTCFYLAVKMYQAGPILSTQQIAMISGFSFSSMEVADMEQRVLVTLDWCLYPPCAAEFVRPYLSILLSHSCVPTNMCLYELVNEALGMLNAALLLDYFFVAHELPPSHLAAAALLTAMRSFAPYSDLVPTVQEATEVLMRESGSWMDATQISLCCKRLWNIHDSERARCWNPSSSIPCTPDLSSFRCGSSSSPSSPVGVMASLQSKATLDLFVPNLSSGPSFSSIALCPP